jgi:hypothetical protein
MYQNDPTINIMDYIDSFRKLKPNCIGMYYTNTGKPILAVLHLDAVTPEIVGMITAENYPFQVRLLI